MTPWPGRGNLSTAGRAHFWLADNQGLLARLLRHVREAKGAAHAITPPAPAIVQRLGERLRRTSALVWRVLAQTRARVLRGTPIIPTRW